jgi:DNA-binding GntR family transcriptional regulator
VPPRTADELEEVFSLRVLVEAAGIRRTVPTLQGRQARRLVELTYAMDRCLKRSDTASLAKADRAFHLGLVVGGGLRLRTLAEELAGCAEDHLRTQRGGAEAVEATLREHRRILGSALDQDVEECVQRTVDHHVRAVMELVTAIEPGHALHRVRIAALQATGIRITALDAV